MSELYKEFIEDDEAGYNETLIHGVRALISTGILKNSKSVQEAVQIGCAFEMDILDKTNVWKSLKCKSNYNNSFCIEFHLQPGTPQTRKMHVVFRDGKCIFFSVSIHDIVMDVILSDDAFIFSYGDIITYSHLEEHEFQYSVCSEAVHSLLELSKTRKE